MMQKLKYSSLLLLTAAIWGFSFVAQKSGMEYIGPFTFNGIRFALGSLSLLPLFYFFNRNKKELKSNMNAFHFKNGLILGLVLFIAASLQQIGMIYTTAANGGFITSLYVIIVPLLGLFIGKKIGFNIWIGALIAVIGLYLLSFNEKVELQIGDSLILASALFFALHIILIEKYVSQSDVILLSVFQFGATGILSLMVAFFAEEILWSGIYEAFIPILYAGLLSVGIAYTLQVFAQKKVQAEVAAIILSFESAFAMLGGWLILNEQHQWKALLGAGLMLAGIILSQIKFKSYEKTYK